MCVISCIVFFVEVILFGQAEGVFYTVVDKTMSFSGSLAFATLMYSGEKFSKSDIFTRVGMNTLPIYAIHWCLLFNPQLICTGEKMVRICMGNLYIAAITLTGFWLLVCYIVILFLRKVPVLKVLFLGEKR